jgi:hypothetical protein
MLPTTAFYRAKLPQPKGVIAMRRMTTENRNTILRLLVERNSIRSITRLLGTDIKEVLRQLT